MYNIKIITSPAEVDLGEKALIDIYNWGGDYRPYAYGVVCYIENKGFVVKLYCEEKNPIATVQPPFGHVCIDSCLEFFANFTPTVVESPYINFETNCLGALCCEFSPKGGLRPKFVDNGIPLPKVTPFVEQNYWGAIIEIDLTLLESVYGKINFSEGDIITGNFFKCGDKTAHIHYGSHTEIKTEQPSFHQPQFFTEMVLVK